jgi:hypothetical protein
VVALALAGNPGLPGEIFRGSGRYQVPSRSALDRLISNSINQEARQLAGFLILTWVMEIWKTRFFCATFFLVYRYMDVPLLLKGETYAH